MAIGWIRRVVDNLLLRKGGPNFARQYGAIPYTVVQNQVVFLLVTSRRTGRWIFPKGDPMQGLAPFEAAAQEAAEEAGVEGEIDPQPIGTYRTFKTLPFRRTIVHVEMFGLRVTRQFDDWPEKSRRHRHWAILPEARRLLSDVGVGNLAAQYSQRLRLRGLPSYPPIDHITR